jgi:hypothetical protein
MLLNNKTRLLILLNDHVSLENIILFLIKYPVKIEKM